MGLLWVTKHEDGSISAMCSECEAEEFIIHNWEDTPWAEGPHAPIDVHKRLAELEQLKREQLKRELLEGGDATDTDDHRGHPLDAQLGQALRAIGSSLTPGEARRIVQSHDMPTGAIQAIVASAKRPSSKDAVERLLPVLMEVWNDTPRSELGGQSPSARHAGRPFMAPVTPIRAKPSVDRNEPCPCGSGKKYKRCCLRSDLN